ncbi:hypothetical protein TWF281_006031 [Arthrobotrys megalospora]
MASQRGKKATTCPELDREDIKEAILYIYCHEKFTIDEVVDQLSTSTKGMDSMLHIYDQYYGRIRGWGGRKNTTKSERLEAISAVKSRTAVGKTDSVIRLGGKATISGKAAKNMFSRFSFTEILFQQGILEFWSTWFGFTNAGARCKWKRRIRNNTAAPPTAIEVCSPLRDDEGPNSIKSSFWGESDN